MDQPIERRHIVYAVPQGGLVTCPADQQPLHVRVVYSGRQQECERYMRDTARLTQRERKVLGWKS